MSEGTRADYEFLRRCASDHNQGLPDRIIRALERLEGSFSGYQVTRLEHSLQSASRAFRNNEDPEVVMAALLHDIGDDLAPHSHDELAAAVLRPFVSERVLWIVKHHSIFQKYYYAHHLGGNRNARDRLRDSPYYEDAVRFCELYDQGSFDPSYDTLPLSHFEPMIRELFSRKPRRPRHSRPARWAGIARLSRAPRIFITRLRALLKRRPPDGSPVS